MQGQVVVELLNGPGGGSVVTIDLQPAEGKIVRIPRLENPDNPMTVYDSYRLHRNPFGWNGEYVGVPK